MTLRERIVREIQIMHEDLQEFWRLGLIRWTKTKCVNMWDSFKLLFKIGPWRWLVEMYILWYARREGHQTQNPRERFKINKDMGWNIYSLTRSSVHISKDSLLSITY